MAEFMECSICAAKPGSPTLCPSCLHNRALIGRLENQSKNFASAMKKFAPDLTTEFVQRYMAATTREAGDFLDLLKGEDNV